MNDVILKAENVSKQYRLGLIGTGTISHDLNRWWNRIRGKEDPYLKIGEINDRSTKGDSDYVWALKDINFEVERGEVLGIIGKNGAGKSTLLKILSRVTSPTKGEIKTKGRIASLLEVGTGFHPEMTGRENVYLNGAILGMTKKEITSKIDEIIEFSGCERYIDTPVKRYSSGMKVRLAFAVAAHLEPDILIVDEVLAVGDAEFQKKAIGKMQDISQGQGRTVLFVSHNMGAIRNLCSRCILINNGEVVYEGDTEKVINKYLKDDEKAGVAFLNNDRYGNGKIKVKSVEVYGGQKGEKPTVFGSLNLKFILDNENEVKISEIRFDIRIDDSSGQRLMWMSTETLENTKTDVLDSIIFNLDKLNLNSGKYYVTTYIEVNENVADWVQNAFSFEVIGGNHCERLKKIPSNQGAILSDYEIQYNTV